MASQRTYHEAMKAAVDAASFDPTAAHDERVTFERKTLDRVVALFKEPGGVRLTKFAYRDLFKEALGERSDLERALTLLVLRDRLIGSRGRQYIEVDGKWQPVGDGPYGDKPTEEMTDQEVAESLSWTEPEEYA